MSGQRLVGRGKQSKAIQNTLAQKMDAQLFAIVKAELKEPSLFDDIED